jgi:hypothetical protein
MTSSTTYRAIFPISLAAIALVALWGYTQHSSTPRLQLSVPIEVIDTNAEHPRRLASKPNVNLRGIFEDSADRKAKERQHGTERRTKECLPPLPPPPLPGKKGIGFTLREEGMLGSWVENIPKVVALNPYWNYSWGSKRVEAQPDNIEFVPMLWGAWGDTGLINRIVSDIFPQIQSGQAKRVLGFNEPDYEAQSNLPVQDVVSYWHILEDIGIPLASPSVAHGTGSWMDDFMGEAEANCLRMEYVALHWYGGVNAAEFKNHMRVAYELYGSRRPLLITEFAPADWSAEVPEDNRWSQANVLAFMKEVLPWLEDQDMIAGYAWFSFKQTNAAGTSSALYDLDGKLTALGQFYASVTTENPAGDQLIEV